MTPVCLNDSLFWTCTFFIKTCKLWYIGTCRSTWSTWHWSINYEYISRSRVVPIKKKKKSNAVDPKNWCVQAWKITTFYHGQTWLIVSFFFGFRLFSMFFSAKSTYYWAFFQSEFKSPTKGERIKRRGHCAQIRTQGNRRPNNLTTQGSRLQWGRLYYSMNACTQRVYIRMVESACVHFASGKYTLL